MHCIEKTTSWNLFKLYYKKVRNWTVRSALTSWFVCWSFKDFSKKSTDTCRKRQGETDRERLNHHPKTRQSVCHFLHFTSISINSCWHLLLGCLNRWIQQDQILSVIFGTMPLVWLPELCQIALRLHSSLMKEYEWIKQSPCTPMAFNLQYIFVFIKWNPENHH